MSRIRTGYVDIDDLPIAFTRGHGKPIGWHEGARCRSERAPRPVPVKGEGSPTAWIVDPDRKYRFGTAVLKGKAIQAMACLECALCSVQWECASFAIQVDEPAGVWAMSVDDREWLQGQPDAMQIIRRAQREERPVQYAVVSVRRYRARKAATMAC